MKPWPGAVMFFAAAAALFTASGFLPHRIMLPLDLPRDSGAWKPNPLVRVAVSNRLLSDPIFEYLAWDREIRRLVGSRQFPWRNRFAGDGAHLFANPETSLFFPLTWIRLILGDRGWAVSLFLKLFFAGLGMWWFARVVTDCHWRSALIGGFAYLTSGYMTVWLLFPHTNVYAILPWLGASAIQMSRAPTRKAAALVIACSALATAGGHPETLFFGVIALAIFVLWGVRSRAIVTTAACAAIGFLIIAVQLVPFAMALSKSFMLSQRAAHSAGGMRLFAIPATLLPGYFGSPLAGEIDLSGLAQPAAENFSERSNGYAGFASLLVIALMARRLSAGLRRGLLIGSIALLISWRVPIFRLIDLVPPFSVAATERLGLVFIFFTCLALGIALDELARSKSRRGTAAIVAIVGALLLAGGLVLALPAMRPALTRAGREAILGLQHRHYLRLPPEVYEARLGGYIDGLQRVAPRRFALPGACLITLAVALLTRRRAIAAAAIAAEMAGFAYGYNPVIDASSAARTPPPIRDVLRLDPERRFFVAAAADVYPPNMGTIDGVRDVRSYDVLQTRSRIETLRAFGYDVESRAFSDPRALGPIGVRWFLAQDGLHEIGGAVPQPWPQNKPPDGFAAGAVISILAVAAAITIIYKNDRAHDLPLPNS